MKEVIKLHTLQPRRVFRGKDVAYNSLWFVITDDLRLTEVYCGTTDRLGRFTSYSPVNGFYGGNGCGNLFTAEFVTSEGTEQLPLPYWMLPGAIAIIAVEELSVDGYTLIVDIDGTAVIREK